MSHKATNWAVSQRGISPVAKVLLWQLADRHNPDNGCFPDQDTLARDCEISRATVNRNLLDLERVGLVKRVKRDHPITGKRLPTRYYLAFEDEFAAIVGDRGDEESDVETDQNHVSNCDMVLGPNHVSPQTQTMSHQSTKPCLTDETCSSSLTSKLTGKGTGKRAERADRGSIFKSIWKVFPLRPNSPETEAWELFEKLDEADLPVIEKGAERYAQWFREEAARKGETYQDACGFAPYLVNWLRGQKWIEAKSLPVSVKLGAEAAAVMAGKVTVNKWRQMALFEACEQALGRSVPIGKTGSWSFDEAVVEVAKKGLGSGQGPP